MEDDALLKALSESRKGAANGKSKGNANWPIHSSSDSTSNPSEPVGSIDLGVADLGVAEVKAIDTSMFEHKMPPIKPMIESVAGNVNLTKQQRANVSLIAFALDVHMGEAISADRIYELWPTSKFKADLINQAGPRPSLTGISQFLGTDDYAMRMAERGIVVSGPVGLSPEQIALIAILSNTISRETIHGRLKRAGISYNTYTAWRRQRAFTEALTEATGAAMRDAVENTDVQLAVMAQNGDLRAIQYFNELMGRAPDDKKAVDAMAFAKLILEVVQRQVTPAQALAISSEVGLLAKQMQIGRQ